MFSPHFCIKKLIQLSKRMLKQQTILTPRLRFFQLEYFNHKEQFYAINKLPNHLSFHNRDRNTDMKKKLLTIPYDNVITHV